MGLCCGRRDGVVAATSAVQSRRAVDHPNIFHAVGDLEQIGGRAPGAPRSEVTRLTRRPERLLGGADGRMSDFSVEIGIVTHWRRSAASNASCRPKIKQSPPLVTNTEPRASRTAVGGAGGEDGASIDLGLHGCWCRGRNGRNRRQVGRGGG
jgi:hypothetical protein